MPLAYGNTPFGHKNALKEALFEYGFSQGQYIKQTDFDQLDRLSMTVSKIFMCWIEKEVPEILYLYDCVKKLTENDGIAWGKNFQVNLPYFSYTITPLINTTVKCPIRYTLKGKHITFKFRQNTSKYDYEKIRNSFVANLIQAFDAMLLTLYLSTLKKERIRTHLFFIHDRYFINPIYAISKKIYYFQVIKPFFSQIYWRHILNMIFPKFMKCYKRKW